MPLKGGVEMASNFILTSLIDYDCIINDAAKLCATLYCTQSFIIDNILTRVQFYLIKLRFL